ncbi:hypothetical protein BBJ28_00024266, partial [Nothophytophthora sp. Chile5]
KTPHNARLTIPHPHLDGASAADGDAASAPHSEPLPIPSKKPRAGSLSGSFASFSSFSGSFGNLQAASGSAKKKKKKLQSDKMHANLHSPQLLQSASARRGSVVGATAEDACVFVDQLIRAAQLQIREELGFREVLVSTGEDAAPVHMLRSSSILNEPRGPSSISSSASSSSASAENSDVSLCPDCAQATVYVSPGYDHKPRLLVIVPYREAGIWSRSICMNQADSDGDRGSMLAYLKQAVAEDYGVLILNPAAQACHPRAHVEHAWDQLVAPLTSDVFIVAFSRGAQLVQQLLNYDDGRAGGCQDRVRALALVEPSHYVSDRDSYFARRILSRRAVAWILSADVAVGSQIPAARAHVQSSVFGSFAARCGEAAGVTVNAAKLNACGLCHRKLSLLNRRIPCSWCQVKYCSRCCADQFVPTFGRWRVCTLCQSLPCLIDPRRQNRSAPNHTSPSAALSAKMRTSVFIRPAADDDDPVCLADFEIVKLVGRGACGRVKLVRKTHGYDEGVLYAMKAIRKKLVIQRGLVEATNAERRILDRITHPYVATLRYAFQTDAKLYLLSKYYPGGNLLDQMRLARRFTEDRTRLYAAEVALAIHHLHQNDIIYRDLKLENVLVDADGHVALTDFGMSKENMPDAARTSTFVGTYQMMAPEVFSGKSYSRAVDWWALGVMVFEMIDGRTPFNAKTNRLIKERIVNVDLKFSPRFTEDAKDFVAQLLTKDEADRLGCGPNGFVHIQSHPWFHGLDWDDVAHKEALFEGQSALMSTHAKEFRTEDIFDTYMDTVEVPVDTPASVKSANAELFSDFAFNYMDGPDDAEQRDEPEPDEEDPVSSPSAHGDDGGLSITSTKPLTKKEDDMLDSFLTSTGSHFDISLLRPDQATDFGLSGCSSLSSEGAEDAVPVEKLEDDALLKVETLEKQPVSPASDDVEEVEATVADLTKEAGVDLAKEAAVVEMETAR